MGRAAQHTDQDILDAALDLVAEDGVHAATAVAIAKKLGAPSGSVYYRFPSRDLILATLWIRTVKGFQIGFLEALAAEDPEAAARAAVAHTLTWTDAHRKEAKLLTLYRREDLIALWPEELGQDLTTLNDEVKRAVKAFTVAHFGRVDAETIGRSQFALIDLPYSAARQLLRAERTPPWLFDSVIAASAAVLRVDRSSS
ncbi:MULTISPECIES: TetR/AcrR family transcriptional regulator [unclassified Microbacterium]|uniref:TetR/AcrR family transcriptional regulator n=1 Tax=unclassified Microbacterium TaxID=2609290 RepID=UPI0016034CB3|nr:MULTISPECIES: TetR/AcrR family transcriptional regulator [unclassified Microbacterium]MBT2484675.1 TetR/AcrR family transcriptional regulator [Microbacterium sp. ISL-108]